jgi:hypothetical protein
VPTGQYSQSMSSVDPESIYDELFEPLALAIGHMVLAATLLERGLLVDLIQRKVGRDGPNEVFGQGLVTKLERQPAGVLLAALRELGYEVDLAAEITAVIGGRNHFVHHLFEDPEFIKAFATREGVDQLVERVEELTEDIYRVVKKLEPGVTSCAEAMFGGSSSDLLQAVKQINPVEIDDDELRKQMEALQTFPDDFMEQ